MLSSEEERIWDDVQRFWLEEADEPSLPQVVAAPVPGSDVPTAVVVGVSSTILLLLFGAVVAALVVAAAAFAVAAAALGMVLSLLLI